MHRRGWILATGLILGLMSAPPAGAAGKIIVANDEWTLSNAGYTNAGGTNAHTWATNVTSFFSGGPGTFHAYSTNFGLTGTMLAGTMNSNGHTYTTGTGIAWSVASLQNYDGIFLAGNAVPDQQVLIDYVNAGGNVYVEGGTGAGGAVNEAARWNTFLGAFGLQYAASYNTGTGNLPIVTSEPLFNGINQLYQAGGQEVIVTNTMGGKTRLLINSPNPGQTSPSRGQYGIFDGSINSDSVPEPTSLLLMAAAMPALALRRRRHRKSKSDRPQETP